MAKIAAILILLVLAGCSAPEPAIHINATCEPFAHLEWRLMSDADRRSLSEASEDFCAVLAGGAPIHARLDSTFKPKGNGSTKRYLGRGYQLTALRNVSYVGGVSSGVVGPVLRLDSRLASDGPVEISQIRVVGLPPVR